MTLLEPRSAVLVEALSEWLGRTVHSREVRGLIEAYAIDQRAELGDYAAWDWCAIWSVTLIRQHEPTFGPRWGWGSASALRDWAIAQRRWAPVGAAPVGSLLVRTGHVGILLGHHDQSASPGWADSIDGNVGQAVTTQSGAWDGAILWGCSHQTPP